MRDPQFLGAYKLMLFCPKPCPAGHSVPAPWQLQSGSVCPQRHSKPHHDNIYPPWIRPSKCPSQTTRTLYCALTRMIPRVVVLKNTVTIPGQRRSTKCWNVINQMIAINGNENLQEKSTNQISRTSQIVNIMMPARRENQSRLYCTR